MKLNDAQLVLLSAASQREDGAVVLESSINGSNSKANMRKLLAIGLLEEVPTGTSLPPWRRDDDGGAIALRITEPGLAAIGLGAEPPENTARPNDADSDAKGSRNKPIGRRRSKQTSANTEKVDKKRKGPQSRVAAKPPSRPAGGRHKTKKTASESKQARVIEMLQSPKGATIEAMMKATGWQQHSVRGFLAGVVRNRLKLTLDSDKVDDVRVYRITGAAGGRKAGSLRPNQRSA